MGSKSKRPALREHKIPPRALVTGKRLMDEQNAASQRYNTWAADLVDTMNLDDPREGCIWLVNPVSGTVREQPKK